MMFTQWHRNRYPSIADCSSYDSSRVVVTSPSLPWSFPSLRCENHQHVVPMWWYTEAIMLPYLPAASIQSFKLRRFTSFHPANLHISPISSDFAHLKPPCCTSFYGFRFKPGVGKCPNWTSPNYGRYQFQQIFVLVMFKHIPKKRRLPTPRGSMMLIIDPISPISPPSFTHFPDFAHLNLHVAPPFRVSVSNLGLVNAPIEHHPTMGDINSNRYKFTPGVGVWWLSLTYQPLVVAPHAFPIFDPTPPGLPHPVQAKDPGRSPPAGRRQGAKAVEQGDAIAWRSAGRFTFNMVARDIWAMIYFYCKYLQIISMYLIVLLIFFCIYIHAFMCFNMVLRCFKGETDDEKCFIRNWTYPLAIKLSLGP